MNIVHLIMIEIIYMYNVRQLGQKYNFPQSTVFCSHIDKIAFDGHKITTKYNVLPFKAYSQLKCRYILRIEQISRERQISK